jgi:ABC-type transport system involved in multi-copper enzyme maturation permease subunit
MTTINPEDHPRPEAPSSVLALLVRAGVIELLRRREFSVLLILMGLFGLGVLITRIVGIENAATATFLKNLGMSLAFALTQLLTVIHSARQFPDELETRTLHPLLAKPISRGQYLLGKWLASCVAGVVTLLSLFALAYFPVPELEEFSRLKLVQVLLLQVMAVGMAAALAQLASLLMPKALATAVVLLTLFGSGPILNLLRNYADGAGYGQVVRWVTSYIPSLQPMDLLLSYTNGLPAEGPAMFLLRLAYPVSFIFLSLVLSRVLLERRPL